VKDYLVSAGILRKYCGSILSYILLDSCCILILSLSVRNDRMTNIDRDFCRFTFEFASFMDFSSRDRKSSTTFEFMDEIDILL
jgi:hypothetical protein